MPKCVGTGVEEARNRPPKLLDAAERGQTTLITRRGSVKAGDEALARRYRTALESWHVVDLDPDVAESAARLRASLGRA